MTTVSKTPVAPKMGSPPNGGKPGAFNIVTDSNSPTANAYSRPTAGGNASGPADGPLGTAPARPPAGVVPGPEAYRPPTPGPATAGGTQAGADIGSGATIIKGQPDATGHPASETGGGTVGDSGPQGGA